MSRNCNLEMGLSKNIKNWQPHFLLKSRNNYKPDSEEGKIIAKEIARRKNYWAKQRIMGV
tara:strand:+ start:1378 stop:1557 length:180 start_codon:yes stop_codon:yes gene_type:complete